MCFSLRLSAFALKLFSGCGSPEELPYLHVFLLFSVVFIYAGNLLYYLIQCCRGIFDGLTIE